MLLGNKPHPLCLLAAEQLQQYLRNQKEWEHNFGLTADTTQTIIGKMFGVLVVQTPAQELGYIAAFSGKLAGANVHAQFVPPVFDSLTADSFFNLGMAELTRINKEIKNLQAQESNTKGEQIRQLKTARKRHSISLQKELFDHYFFLNQAGETKSVYEIFSDAAYKNPPSGAGECATPKLLQYAFQHELKPIAIAEFWWGQSPKSTQWKHGHFYPCCNEKCKPILAHMLSGLEYELK
jgi:tRNA pseudouridine32 synthase/23S rRNA pseudouridine746 synthase